MTKRFGNYIKQLRLDRGITLRSFCIAANLDTVTYSKIERGLLPPPTDLAELEPHRIVLGLTKEDTDWRELVRLAVEEDRGLASGGLSERELVGRLPVMLGNGDGVDEMMLDELVAAIRREHSPVLARYG